MIVVAALAWTPSSAADVGLILRKATVRPGEAMTLWGPCGRMPIYLLPDAHARGIHLDFVSPPVRRPPRARPFRLLGRLVCTGRVHYVGDYPRGDWASWGGRLRFRIPNVRAGLYQLVVYCEPCHRGPGGTLIANNFLWRGSQRVGETALRILPPLRRTRPG